jgi:hypothetical protein
MDLSVGELGVWGEDTFVSTQQTTLVLHPVIQSHHLDYFDTLLEASFKDHWDTFTKARWEGVGVAQHLQCTLSKRITGQMDRRPLD